MSVGAHGLFVTGTGTGVGKTYVSRGLARAALERGRPVVAVKPFETGCDPDPLDALALERAAGTQGVARAPGLYRAALPASPYAATLAGEPAAPALHALASACRALAAPDHALLVEGAGGWLVPFDDRHDLADLQRALGLPAVLVAPDRLGVLSDVLALAEIARYRVLPLQAVVLSRHPGDAADPTRATNARILAERLAPCPILELPATPDDDAALAAAAAAHLGPLLDHLTGGARPGP